MAMRIYKYLLLVVNLSLIAINLSYFENITYSYFGFIPSEYIKYCFADKSIMIDGEEVKLPPGYYLEEYDQDANSGPRYSLLKYDLSGILISLFRPLQPCIDNYIQDYTKEFVEPDYTRAHDVTQVLFSYYKFNDRRIAVRRSAAKFYHYQYQYVYDAVIPEKCINIWAMSNNIDINKFLELVESIAFTGETGEFEAVDLESFKQYF
jgi:hypothetical protein